MATINIESVTKSYGNTSVLKGIDLHIQEGEFIVLIGPSGCGKSTLLRMIAGLEDISSGTVSINNKVVNHIEPKDRDIAMVFQSYALYPHMTVSDNISYSLRLRRVAKEKITELINGAANKLGLEPLLTRRPKALSGGQRQRVAMGRAIVRQPKAFLFDEPLSNLDARLREHMRGEIKKIHQSLDATSIYVTHDQIEAMTLADRIVALNGGVIQQVGSPLELYDKPVNLFVAGFIGSPAMNLLEATILETAVSETSINQDSAAKTAFQLASKEVFSVEEHFPVQKGQSVTIGCRPEHLQVSLTNNGGVSTILDLVEPTGFGSLLHLKVGNVIMRAFSVERLMPKLGTEVFVTIPKEHIHLFNEEGNRIEPVSRH